MPLYFAAPRPVVKRDGAWIMRDDERMELLPGEVVESRMVRFRTLGCYPLTGAVESEAAKATKQPNHSPGAGMRWRIGGGESTDWSG